MTIATKITYHTSFFLVFVYVLIRGFNLGITHDEALTFQIISGDEIMRNTANNHWLNTILSGFSIHLFGEKEFALRLPNIFSFLLLWIFTYQIAKSFFSNKFIQIALLFLIIGNPYLIEFFSLSRGYGISVACVVAALFFLLRIYNSSFSLSNYILVLVFASLALSANLNTINFFFVILFLILFHLTVLNRKQSILLVTGIVFYSAAILYLSLNRLFTLKNHGELYFGSDRFTLSIDSLICSSLPILEPCKFVFFLRFLLYLFVVIAIIIALKNQKINHPGSISLIILIGILIGLVLEHFIFDILYPVGRTTIYLYPIIILSILLNLELLRKKLILICTAIFAATFFFVNLLSFNLEYVTTWKSDQHVKQSLLEIKKDIHDNQIHDLECSWFYEPLINYYRQVYHIPIQKVNRDGIQGQSEYYLIHTSDSIGVINVPNHQVLLSHEEECNLLLLKRLP